MEYHDYHESQHLVACIAANLITQMIMRHMPAGDLTDEVQTILEKQFEILETQIDGEHYGSREIEKFLDYLDCVKKNLEEIQKCR